MEEERSELLDAPTGGPSAGEASDPADKADSALDASAGAGGQDEGQGAVEEATDSMGPKPTPG